MKRESDTEKTCEACGTVLLRKRFGDRLEDRAAFAKRRYCNRLCMAAGMMDDHPTLVAIKARNTKLRGTICQECGTTEGLQIHHINSNKFDNRAENLMTLCGCCHAKWHWKNGKTMPKSLAACSICGKPAQKLGYCQKHYQRFKKYGSPVLTKKKNGSQYELVEDRGSV